MLEHVGERVLVATAPRRDIFQKRFFAEIEADNLGHVRVHGLVVGDAGADRIGERDVAGPIRIHQPRNAKRRIRPEGQRVEEVVVEPTVEHIDALRAFGGAHQNYVVADQQIAALDQFNAKLVGEERVLIVGAVVGTGSHERYGRIFRRGVGRDRLQRGEQFFRIVLHGGDSIDGEEVGKEPHHHFAVLQHVGDAGRRAGVVFKDVEVLIVDANDVDSGDLDVDVVG